MARLRREHHRMLGNGYCTRPVELDCAFETICETCTYFTTSITFRPTLRRQLKDAHRKQQTGREQLYHGSSTASTPRTTQSPLDSDYPHK